MDPRKTLNFVYFSLTLSNVTKVYNPLQKWAVEQVDGFRTTKRSADGGVDGRIYFDMSGKRSLQSMVLEVKGGKHVTIQALRALRGVLDAGDAQMAGLITMKPLGDRQQRNFRQVMVQAGDLETTGHLYPRMQMLSVEEILNGSQFRLPNIAGRHEPQPRLLPIFVGLNLRMSDGDQMSSKRFLHSLIFSICFAWRSNTLSKRLFNSSAWYPT